VERLVTMPRFRALLVGSMLGGALSVVLAPRLSRLRRRGPLSGLDRHIVAAFAGTPCSQELAACGDKEPEECQPDATS
jgi:hypothetical protein